MNNVVIYAAHNPKIEFFYFLKCLGIADKEATRAITHQSIFQGVGRSAIRDPNNSKPNQILVMNKKQADFLYEKLPGSKMDQVTEVVKPNVKPIGRPKNSLSLSGAEKKQLSRIADVT